jgi:hypothetical protein
MLRQTILKWRAVAVVGGLAAYSVSPSSLADAVIIAYCEDVQEVGIAKHANMAIATANALRNCIAGGGDAECCKIVGGAEAGECVALALNSDGDVGIGYGEDLITSQSEAVLQCAASGCRARYADCSE